MIDRNMSISCSIAGNINNKGKHEVHGTSMYGNRTNTKSNEVNPMYLIQYHSDTNTNTVNTTIGSVTKNFNKSLYSYGLLTG